MSEILDLATSKVQQSKAALCKFITANDTGSTGGHQYGYHISKEAWSLFLDKQGTKLFIHGHVHRSRLPGVQPRPSLSTGQGDAPQETHPRREFHLSFVARLYNLFIGRFHGLPL